MSDKPTKTKDDGWMAKKWRPMMAVTYMIICICDFVVFPVLYTVVQFWETQAGLDAFRQWNPLTLLGGGLFHVAMGAVLGVTAYGRTQEKINGVSSEAPTITPTIPTRAQPAPAAPTVVYTGYNGKPAPAPAAQPLI